MGTQHVGYPPGYGEAKGLKRQIEKIEYNIQRKLVENISVEKLDPAIAGKDNQIDRPQIKTAARILTESDPEIEIVEAMELVADEQPKRTRRAQSPQKARDSRRTGKQNQRYHL